MQMLNSDDDSNPSGTRHTMYHFPASPYTIVEGSSPMYAQGLDW